jgi:alanyl-tRNA synthetase
MYATYFEGDDDVPADNEARDIWLALGLPAHRVIASNKADNFWEMGDTGPCGPCSEIHFDRIGGRDASALVNMDDPDVIEIWNLVFMQYFRNDDSSLIRLPFNHVDTGMGLERVTGILQGVQSNYDTDIFLPLFDAIQTSTITPEQPTGCRDYTGKLGKEDTDGVDMAYRVVADHIRTLTFAITDGAMPSSDGRGYVLRRILRRAVRFGDEKLNAPRGYFSSLVPAVVANFSDAYPELVDKAGFVQEVLREEEMSFNRTLRKGRERFEKAAEAVEAEGKTELPGALAFFLYDSMGFPLDLTQIMAEERGMTVDADGFHTAMEEQRAMSKAARKGASGAAMLKLEAEQTAHLAATGVEPTVDAEKYDWYIKPRATIKAIYTSGGFAAPETAVDASAGIVGVVLDTTSFYYESGGQESDTGVIAAETPGSGTSDAASDAASSAASSGAGSGEDAGTDDIESESSGVLDVEGAQAFGGFVLHMGTLRSGSLSVGQTVRVGVDYTRRELLAPNHTMTHVLNFGLRRVLGEAVDQRGSLVAADKLRFDFNYGSAMTPAELQEVEAIVNGVISKAAPVYNKVVPLADGRSIASLRAVFGETYPDPVRVVSVGAPVDEVVADPANPKWSGMSIEFCGGTHLRNTSNAGRFCIVEETAVSKGTRRVVCVTKDAAVSAFNKGEELLARFAEARSMKWQKLQDVTPTLKECLDNWTMPAHTKAALRKELTSLEKKVFREKKAEQDAIADALIAEVAAAAEAGAGGSVAFVKQAEGAAANAKTVGAVVNKLTKKHKAGTGYGAALVWCAEDGKFAVAAMVPKDSALVAKDWVEAALGDVEGTVRAAKNGLSAQVAGKATDSAAGIGERASAFAASKLDGAAAAAAGSA